MCWCLSHRDLNFGANIIKLSCTNAIRDWLTTQMTNIGFEFTNYIQLMYWKTVVIPTDYSVGLGKSQCTYFKAMTPVESNLDLSRHSQLLMTEEWLVKDQPDKVSVSNTMSPRVLSCHVLLPNTVGHVQPPSVKSMVNITIFSSYQKYVFFYKL